MIYALGPAGNYPLRHFHNRRASSRIRLCPVIHLRRHRNQMPSWIKQNGIRCRGHVHQSLGMFRQRGRSKCRFLFNSRRKVIQHKPPYTMGRRFLRTGGRIPEIIIKRKTDSVFLIRGSRRCLGRSWWGLSRSRSLRAHAGTHNERTDSPN
jgi:hypothetical protein